MSPLSDRYNDVMGHLAVGAAETCPSSGSLLYRKGFPEFVRAEQAFMRSSCKVTSCQARAERRMHLSSRRLSQA
jgi:hypothetical protein